MKSQLLFFALAVFLLLPGLALAAAEATCSQPPAQATPTVEALSAPELGAQGLEKVLPPEPQERPCWTCTWFFNTSTYWGIGADCTASYNDLVSQVSAEATSTGPGLCIGAGADGYCGYDLVITGSCHWDSSHSAYVTDGHGKIKCRENEC